MADDGGGPAGSVDAEARTCVVEPGIVLDELDRRLSGYGPKFGPKPSTHSHCSLGGMIGNYCSHPRRAIDRVGGSYVIFRGVPERGRSIRP